MHWENEARRRRGVKTFATKGPLTGHKKSCTLTPGSMMLVKRACCDRFLTSGAKTGYGYEPHQQRRKQGLENANQSSVLNWDLAGLMLVELQDQRKGENCRVHRTIGCQKKSARSRKFERRMWITPPTNKRQPNFFKFYLFFVCTSHLQAPIEDRD